MNAGLEGDREHPVAVLEPGPQEWMTMTEPKAAQAVATISGPRQRAGAIDRAVISSSADLEREAMCLTWRKQVMVWTSDQIKRLRSKHQRPKDPDTRQNPLGDRRKASTGAGWTRPERFLSAAIRVLSRSSPRVSRSRPADTFSQTQDLFPECGLFQTDRLIFADQRRVSVCLAEQ
jgi:hypothetical protein